MYLYNSQTHETSGVVVKDYGSPPLDLIIMLHFDDGMEGQQKGSFKHKYYGKKIIG